MKNFMSFTKLPPTSCVLLVVVFLVGLAFLGCDNMAQGNVLPFAAMEKIELKLPEYPHQTHPPLAGWRICIVINGIEQNITANESSRTVNLSLPRNKATPVLCYPITRNPENATNEGTEFFHPAGCVHPYSTNPTWNDGFTAQVLSSLLKTKGNADIHEKERFCSLFNWERLSSLVKQKESESISNGDSFNPWQLDMDSTLKAIASGKFAKHNVKQKKIHCVRIQIPSKVLQSIHTSNKLYSKFIPQENPELTRTGGKTFIYATVTESRDKYTLNTENSFLCGGITINVFADKKGKTRLVTTEHEQ